MKIISRQPDEVMGKKGKLQQKEFCNHLIDDNVIYRDIFFLESSRTVLNSLPVTIAAEKRLVASWFKRQFGNFRSAFGASPVAFEHLTWARKILVVHCYCVS